MNVLFVVDSLNDGGAGRVVARLSSFFSRQGITVYVLPIFDNAVSYKLDDSVELFQSFEEPLKHSVAERVRLIRRSAKESSADVVISFLSYINLYAIVAGLGNRWKTIISERNNPYTDPANKKIRFARKYLYHLSDGFVFQTEDARDYFASSIRNRSCVIPNPVADDIIEPYREKRSKKVVSAGRLTKQKNYEMALRAMKSVLEAHPDYVYEIYGQGEEEELLKKKAEQLGISDKVVFKGHVEDLLTRIQDAAAFVMSSDFEGMSNSLIEALAIGLPVVSTDHPIGGARLLIKNGVNGILVPVGNDEELAKAVNLLLDNDEFANQISNNGVEVRNTCSIESIGGKWLTYIKNIL